MCIKGFYIEDELENINSLRRHFNLEGIELHYKEELLESPNQYYDLFCELKINFLIIDKNLDKKGMGYSGLDVLKEIRKQDSNIYIVLITSYVNEIEIKDLSEFDQVIDKGNLESELDSLIIRIKRSYNRSKVKQTVDEFELGMTQKTSRLDSEILELKKINETIEKLLKEKH
ncbi:response regulator [Paenibacillus ehimensis]|uniref:response regulator n=1 Tax=Paenibacillus ehimensis TaxID=79264 RepID=UPI002DBE60FC|nr:response regulator [Paenibacillus ehimensis]MEC0210989.1 response regulator [Paenibacillus ehimensis]